VQAGPLLAALMRHLPRPTSRRWKWQVSTLEAEVARFEGGSRRTGLPLWRSRTQLDLAGVNLERRKASMTPRSRNFDPSATKSVPLISRGPNRMPTGYRQRLKVAARLEEMRKQTRGKAGGQQPRNTDSEDNPRGNVPARSAMPSRLRKPQSFNRRRGRRRRRRTFKLGGGF